jgi:L-threonylcarbamoyladenylate synthase
MLFNEVSLSIKEGVDFIVKYRQEDLSTANPSRIISFENNTIKIIRD